MSVAVSTPSAKTAMLLNIKPTVTFTIARRTFVITAVIELCS